MIKSICISKNRDKNGVIVNYTLRDANGMERLATGQQIKNAIRNNQLFVDNLQIDKAGRLVDKASDTHKKLGMDKSVELVELMATNLLEGRALTIPNFKVSKVLTKNEMWDYIPKYLIKHIVKILGDTPTTDSLKNLCEILVPRAIEKVTVLGKKVNKTIINCSDTEVAIFELEKE